MSWKNFASDYLSFSRRDRIGILVVFFLMLILLFFPTIIGSVKNSRPSKEDSSWIAVMKQLESKEGLDSLKNDDEGPSAHQFEKTYIRPYAPAGELFEFDPNQLSAAGWKKLGLRDKTIQTIQNYLAKGGRFKKAEDLQKVYGLRKDLYEKLLPYVKIVENKRIEPVISKTEEYKPLKKETLSFSTIDINTSDTTAWISLPGIGSKLAARIVNFRDKLGGFYSVEQVKETFGLPDSIFQKIKSRLKLENLNLKKLNINTATVDDLKAHPYIRYNLANPIIAYRNEHGPFLKIEDLKKLILITDDVYNKIAPYLTMEKL